MKCNRLSLAFCGLFFAIVSEVCTSTGYRPHVIPYGNRNSFRDQDVYGNYGFGYHSHTITGDGDYRYEKKSGAHTEGGYGFQNQGGKVDVAYDAKPAGGHVVAGVHPVPVASLPQPVIASPHHQHALPPQPQPYPHPLPQPQPQPHAHAYHVQAPVPAALPPHPQFLHRGHATHPSQGELYPVHVPVTHERHSQPLAYAAPAVSGPLHLHASATNIVAGSGSGSRKPVPMYHSLYDVNIPRVLYAESDQPLHEEASEQYDIYDPHQNPYYRRLMATSFYGYPMAFKA